MFFQRAVVVTFFTKFNTVHVHLILKKTFKNAEYRLESTGAKI